MKRFDESLAEIRKARQRDPFQSALTVIEADILWNARRYDQATTKYHEALELDPDNFHVHAQLADAYEHRGEYEMAMAEHEKALALCEGAAQMIIEFRRVFQQSGIRGFWKKKIDLLTKAHTGRPKVYEIVRTYIELGEKERAFDWLEKMYQERQPVLVYLNVDPIYDHLSSDPRFAELLRRTGLVTQKN
jgi:tetratricopeptide (TPR) repeat protein